MLKYGPFVFLVGFLLGCGVLSVLMKIDLFWIGVVFVGGGVFLKKYGKGVGLRFFIILLCGMLLGCVRVIFGEIEYMNAVDRLGLLKDVSVCVSENPAFVDGKQKIVGSVDGFGDVLISLPLYPAYKYGDQLRVIGKLEKAGTVDDFDYEEYLKMKGVFAVVNNAKVSLNGECGNFFLRVIYGLREWFLVRLNKTYPEPYASFVAGILIGERASIPAQVSDMFTRIGVTHIVAISGYNISIIIVSVSSLLGFLSRRKRAFCSIIFVFVFVVFVGAGSSVVRAGIMGVLNLIGVYFGRGVIVSYALVVTACLMTFWSPKILIYDVSFQLSFLATIGIIYLSDYIVRRLSFIKFKIIKENLAVTLAAQVFTLPVILKSFGFVSWMAPFSNIAILPFIPLSMLLSFVGLLILPVAFLNYVLLEILFLVMRFFDFFMTL